MLDFLSFLTLLSNIFLVLVVFAFLFTKLTSWKIPYWRSINKSLLKYAIPLAFVVALTSILGSLYFSEIAKFTPCKLCWFQRIFMYPLVFVLGVAVFKKTRDVVFYALPLSIIGATIATYHYVLQMLHNPWAPCSSVGFSVSCSDRFVASYGYITIPWMALSAFVLIILLLVLSSGRIKS